VLAIYADAIPPLRHFKKCDATYGGYAVHEVWLYCRSASPAFNKRNWIEQIFEWRSGDSAGKVQPPCPKFHCQCFGKRGERLGSGERRMQIGPDRHIEAP